MRDKSGFFFLLFVAVLVCGESNSDEDSSIESQNECNVYCLKALKPLIDTAVEREKNITVQQKNEQIEKLQNELVDWQANIPFNTDFEKMFNEIVNLKDELAAALSEKSCIKEQKILSDSLKAKIEENTEAVNELKAQVAGLISSVRLQSYNPKQQSESLIQEQAMNCVPYENSTSTHLIDVVDFGSFMVLCDGQTAGLGWTVVQRRFNGKVDFYRSWSEYRDGFGDLEGEFFMGLEKLHRMTISLPYELYIQLVDFNDVVRYARYDSFLVGSEQEQYMLKSLGTYSGNAGNALAYNLHDSFTTYDRDNDNWGGGNCADWYQSGWWYNLYGNSNLNGKYFSSEVNNEESIWWCNWKGYRALKSVQIMIRPKYSSI